jgi:hypothetical protein
MQVQLLSSVPPSLRPLRTYETTFLSMGFGRYDTERKTVTKLIETDGILTFQETPFEASIFPRAYHAEMARVTIYSDSPRVWSETVDDQTFVFQQQTD